MPRNDFDITLLGKLAGSLEEIGDTLRVMRVESTTNSKDIAKMLAEVQQAASRLHSIEKSLNGNGKPGLKSEMLLARTQLKEMKAKVDELTVWRASLSQQQIKDLRSELVGRKPRYALWIALAGVIVTAIVGIPTCIPYVKKALADSPTKAKANDTVNKPVVVPVSE